MQLSTTQFTVCTVHVALTLASWTMFGMFPMSNERPPPWTVYVYLYHTDLYIYTHESLSLYAGANGLGAVKATTGFI